MTETTAQPTSLQERTLPGLHATLFAVLERYVPRPGPVLDLGAGSGAWASRLATHGYQVTAAERDASAFRLAGTECLQLDLNESFASRFGGRRFKAVSAVEVIEHLENPRAFLRECRALVEPDGVILVTTPNIQNVPARLRYLTSGELRLFGRDPALNDMTHITPIHTFMLEKMLADTHLTLVEHAFDRPSARATRLFPRVLSAILAPLLGGVKGGDCHIFVIRRA